MIKNSVTIDTSSLLSGYGVVLCGEEAGKNIYQNQVLKKIDLEKDFEIIFPDDVKCMSMSFIDGMFSDILKEIGTDHFKTRMSIYPARYKKLIVDLSICFA